MRVLHMHESLLILCCSINGISLLAGDEFTEYDEDHKEQEQSLSLVVQQEEQPQDQEQKVLCNY